MNPTHMAMSKAMVNIRVPSKTLLENKLQEVIVLPVDERRSSGRVRSTRSTEPLILDAYPNPTTGLVYVVCNVSMGSENSKIVIRDMHGRIAQQVSIGVGASVVELDLSSKAAGLYTATMLLDGVPIGQVKVAVQ